MKLSDKQLKNVFGDETVEQFDIRNKKKVDAKRTSTAKEIQAIKAGDLMSKTPKPFPYLAEGLIPEHALTVVAGNTGCGKSLINLYFADRISKGKKILEEIETKKVNVLIIDQEMTEDDYIDRTKKFCQPNNNVWISCEQSFKIEDSGRMAKLLEFIKYNNIELVIFDTLSKIHAGNENDNTEMTKVMDYLVNICRDNKISMVLVHHHNKSLDQSGYGKGRGASSIVDNCASYLEVSSKPFADEMGMNCLAVTIKQHKSRRKLSTNEFGIIITNYEDDSIKLEYLSKPMADRDKLDEAKVKILAYIKKNPGLSKRKITEYVMGEGILKSHARDAIDILIQTNQLEASNGPRNSQLLIIKTDISQVSF